MKIKKQLLAFLCVASMALAMPVTAFAADGTEADGPADGSSTNKSTGSAAAEATYDADGNVTSDWQITDDDDAAAAATDKTTDISVWGKVSAATDKVYKVDIAWGAMTFEFKSGGTWDPETHTYKGAEDGTTDPGWTAESVDGTNNKITLTNHSNDDVQADFTTNVESTLFGTDNKVVGNFFADNAKALAAAKVLEPAAPATDLEIVDILAGGVKLDTADPGDGTDGTATTTDVYYALSGKPTADATLKSAVQKIGTITVTLSPYTAPEA